MLPRAAAVSVIKARALAVPLVAYGLLRCRRSGPRGFPVDADGVESRRGVAQVEIWNDSASPILVQGYRAQDVIHLWPACRLELAPGERRSVEVSAGPLGQETLQLAVRFRYCAKLLRVSRGARLIIGPASRGRAAAIDSRPRNSIVSMRDISHWSRVCLPEAGGADSADVDGLLGRRSRRDRLQAWAAMRLYLGADKGNTEVAVPLQVVASSNARLPARLLPATAASLAREGLPPAMPTALQVPPGAVVIGTVRCGYGHHRIALALASFGVPGRPTLLHDFAAVEGSAPPVELLLRLDNLYSRCSRMASEDRTGLLSRAWNELLASGDANASRTMRAFCERLKPLLLAVPPETPVVAAHTFVAITALLCGCRRVINLVFDNHAQPVHAVPPPAINCVQTAKCEQQLLAMGMPASHVKLVGHFIPKELADNAVCDTELRMGRARRGAPRRFLLSVGGAGAQQSFLTGLLRGLAQLSQQLPRGIQVTVNVGDHEHMLTAVLSALREEGVCPSEFHGLNAAVDFVAKQSEEGDPPAAAGGFAVFAGGNPMEAVGITDVLIRAADVLVTKPSELAFYPLPKLHINRIGNHEAQAAIRARELGDGTQEAASVAQALSLAKSLATQEALYLRMCESVLRQAKEGCYEGARRALELAYEEPRGPGGEREDPGAAPG